MSDFKRVILVDDNPVNLMVGANILQGLYQVSTVSSGEKLFRILDTVKPDMILLDIDMPVMNGFDIIQRLKAESRTADIPVIFLTADNNIDYEARGFALGAADFIIKPYYPPLLRKRIELHLLADSQTQIIRKYEQKVQILIQNNKTALGDLQNRMLKTVIELVERRDEVSGGHVERTRRYVEVLLDVLIENNIYQDVVASWEKDLFLQSTIFYDLGKISVKDDILLKPGKLAEDEYNEMKKHTIMGVKIIDGIKAGMAKNSSETSIFDYAKEVAGFHHEKWDGTGYPYGLKGYNIPLAGRIMAIADVYDALIEQKPYKKSYTHEEAAEIIARGKGTHFDPILVDLFITVAEQFKNISKQT
ncbi:MAG: response regulator [Treponema sp.]|jgi:putative two-component system response regulator|nr:response regulator [Treponema sp.]